ncbi:MAG: hypothetical protein H6Q89_4425 [Myxococcaceae bacterium]|nr:hypothetical protein [Myxococcaceae bacterium]
MGRGVEQRPGGGVDVLADELACAGAGKREHPGQHPVGDHSERIEVAARLGRLAHRLLGGEVLRGAEHHPRLGDVVGGRVGVGQPRDSEVEQPRLFLEVGRRRQQHVLGLEVAVDDALGVDRGEALGELGEDPQRAIDRHRAQAQPRLERLALDELHHQAGEVLVEAELDHPHHRRVVDRGEQPRLALEPLGHPRLEVEILAQHLHRHGATEGQLGGAVDQPHSAAAEQGVDPEAAVEDQRAGGERGGADPGVGEARQARLVFGHSRSNMPHAAATVVRVCCGRSTTLSQ